MAEQRKQQVQQSRVDEKVDDKMITTSNVETPKVDKRTMTMEDYLDKENAAEAEMQEQERLAVAGRTVSESDLKLMKGVQREMAEAIESARLASLKLPSSDALEAVLHHLLQAELHMDGMIAEAEAVNPFVG